jgi:hypothetical protein
MHRRLSCNNGRYVAFARSARVIRKCQAYAQLISICPARKMRCDAASQLTEAAQASPQEFKSATQFTLNGGRRHEELRRNFVQRETLEETELDHYCLTRIPRAQVAQGAPDRQRVLDPRLLDAMVRHHEFHRLLWTLAGVPAARVVHQHSAHARGGERQELLLVATIERPLPCQPQVGLVHEHGRLERRRPPLTRQMAARHQPEVTVERFDQFARDVRPGPGA